MPLTREQWTTLERHRLQRLIENMQHNLLRMREALGVPSFEPDSRRARLLHDLSKRTEQVRTHFLRR